MVRARFTSGTGRTPSPSPDRPDGTPVLSHPDDRAHALIGRAEQVLYDGRLLRQVLRREHLAPGTFLADTQEQRLYVWLPGGDDPQGVEMEASVRSRWLSAGPDAGHVHLRGITFRHAANHAQRGAFALQGPDRASGPLGWVVEDCTFERANGPGASFSGFGHIVRRCIFRDNGQLGFGASYCHDTRIEECLIERNNTKGYSTGWEAGGLKVALSRGFAFDGCRVVDNHGSGIWYDIGNEEAEVQGCTIVGNDEAGIFYEISYGLHAHDNLIVGNGLRGESVGGAWGLGGITLSSSEGCVVEHNTLVGNRDGIALREQHRTTPRIDQEQGAAEVAIRNRDHVIRSNVVAYSQQDNVAFWMDTTFFGPHPGGGDADEPPSEDPRTLDIRLEDNLLFALPGRPNYLYGVPWRPRSETFDTPEAFAAGTGIADTSRVGDPRFADVMAGDYRLRPDSPARAIGAGVRDRPSTVR